MGTSIHVCPTCEIPFTSMQTQTAHSRMYYHMVRTHDMRITVGCVPNCTYLKKDEVQKPVAIKRRTTRKAKSTNDN